jgi:hypothetical protein
MAIASEDNREREHTAGAHVGACPRVKQTRGWAALRIDGQVAFWAITGGPGMLTATTSEARPSKVLHTPDSNLQQTLNEVG